MSADKTVMVGTRVTTNIKQRIKALAEKMGITPSRIIGNAIAAYLGDEVAPSPVDRLHDLEQIVFALNDRISKLSQPKSSRENALQDAAKEIPVQCPDCGSGSTRKEGQGKLRKDGTRSQRVLCRDCGKLSAIG